MTHRQKVTLKFLDLPQPHMKELSMEKLLLKSKCFLENPSVTLNLVVNLLPSS